MKQFSDRTILVTLAAVAVVLLCIGGLAMEYGWFGYGALAPEDFASYTVTTASAVPSAVPAVTVAEPSNGSRPPESQPSAPAASLPDAVSPAAPQNIVVNINTATAAELEALPGVGQVIAGHIVEYRDAHGPFTAVEQLLNVKGIGETRLAELRPYVTLS